MIRSHRMWGVALGCWRRRREPWPRSAPTWRRSWRRSRACGSSWIRSGRRCARACPPRWRRTPARRPTAQKGADARLRAGGVRGRRPATCRRSTPWPARCSPPTWRRCWPGTTARWAARSRRWRRRPATQVPDPQERLRRGAEALSGASDARKARCRRSCRDAFRRHHGRHADRDGAGGAARHGHARSGRHRRVHRRAQGQPRQPPAAAGRSTTRRSRCRPTRSRTPAWPTTN